MRIIKNLTPNYKDTSWIEIGKKYTIITGSNGPSLSIRGMETFFGILNRTRKCPIEGNKNCRFRERCTELYLFAEDHQGGRCGLNDGVDRTWIEIKEEKNE